MFVINLSYSFYFTKPCKRSTRPNVRIKTAKSEQMHISPSILEMKAQSGYTMTNSASRLARQHFGFSITHYTKIGFSMMDKTIAKADYDSF